ncbi:MAG TPA: SprB repeat-containing protein, partial [Chitinophagaceae bacterium]|nr:SprB repeat-containing protein [Chitinophagaceae bacterium]
VSCFGGANGSAGVTSAGGTGAVSYNLMPGNLNSQTGNFTGLTAGNYTITGTDANLCSSTTVAIIGTPTVLAITQLSATIPTCVPGADAVLTAVASGATLPYSFNLNGGAFQPSGVFSNLSLGVYTVQVKDANACSITSTLSIVNPVSPVITAIAMTQAGCNPGCDGGLSITSSNGTGAHMYSVNGGPFQSSNTFNNLCASTYTVTVKDASGCTATSTMNVTTLPGPIITNTAVTNILCNGGTNGSIFLSVSGGTGLISYVLQPGNLTTTTASWNNLTAGSYTIVGTDSKGCSTSTLAIISQPVSLSFGTITTQQPSCFGNDNGQIVAPALGGVAPYSYTILPSGTFVAPNTFIGLLGNVNYTITVSDANACSISTVVNLGQPTQVAITSMTTTPVTCFGQSNGTLSAAASGGTGVIQFLLMPGNQTNISGNFINLSGNTYTVTATDANGCTKTSSAFIFEPTDIVINSAIATDIICYGQANGTVNVSASGGMPTLTYLLMPGAVSSTNGLYSNLSAAMYTVTVTDNNGCTESVTKIVNEPSLVQITSIVPTQVKCFGNSDGTITAVGSGGVGQLNFLLMPGNVNNTSGVFSGLPVNTYTITLTDANNCSASTTVTLTQPTPLNLVLDSLHNVTCHGGNDGFIHSTTIGGTLPYLYTLYPNGINSSIGNYNSLFAGTYTLTVSDNNGCKDTLSNLPIIEPAAIIYTNVAHQDITCYQDSSGSITVAAMGGNGNLQHSIAPVGSGIQNPAGYFYGLTGGTYTITTTDAKGCTISTTVTILQNLEVSLDVTFTEPICFGDANGSIEIVASGGTAPLSFSFDNGSFTQATLFTNLTAGVHTIVTMDAKSCMSDTMLVLTQPDKVGATVDLSNAKCNTLNDGYIHASGFGGRNNFTYYLKPGLYVNKTGVFNDLKISTYTLTVKDSAGCIFDTVLVVNPPEDPLAVAITSQNIGCYGVGTEGWAEANPAGGLSPYIYLWNVTPTQTSKRLDNLRYG